MRTSDLLHPNWNVFVETLETKANWWQPANPGSAGKWLLKQFVYVCVPEKR